MSSLQLKQSTAIKIPFFMRDATDSSTGLTGLSPTVTLSKNGAAFGAAGGSAVEIGNGWYYLDANTTDTNTVGSLIVRATATGADTDERCHQVLAALTDDIYSRIGAPAGASIAADLVTIDDFLDSEVAAIKAKTDNLPSDPADQSILEGRFTTIDDLLDTIQADVNDIKAQTDQMPLVEDLVGPQRGVQHRFVFPLYDSNGDPIAGETVTAEVSTHGAAFAASDNSVVEIGDGWYYLDVSNDEMNGEMIAIRTTSAGSEEGTHAIETQGAAP